VTARILRFPTSAAKSVGTTNYFRSCPVCGGSDGIVDEGMTQSGFCHAHQRRWRLGGFNLLRDRFLTVEERKTLVAIDSYEDVT